MATAEEVVAQSPGLKRNTLSRYGKRWHLRENYQMTQEERDKLLDELYGEKTMMMHESTYEYLKPTDKQIEKMAKVRVAAKAYNDVLDAVLPDGPDKTYIIRAHRSNAMWANVAITRQPDGTPRT